MGQEELLSRAAAESLHGDDSLVETIRKLSDGVSEILSSGLNRRAIVVLLHHSTGKIPMGQIEGVLDALVSLDVDYLEEQKLPPLDD